MEKLLELEKRLKEAKAELEKAGGRFSGMAGSVNSTGGTSIASQIGFGKAEDDKKKKDKKNPDEKEDAKLGEEVEHAVERHFEENEEDEKKEGHKLQIKKAENKYGNQMEAKRADIMNQARQPAKVTEGGKTKLVTPEAQVKAKVDSAAEKKGKAEAEAAARRMQYRKEGVLKADDMCKSEESLKFNEWGQWDL